MSEDEADDIFSNNEDDDGEMSDSTENSTSRDSSSDESDSDTGDSETEDDKEDEGYDANNLDNFTITGNKTEKERKDDNMKQIPLVTVNCPNCTRSLLSLSEPGTTMYRDVMDSSTMHAHKILVEKLNVIRTRVHFFAPTPKRSQK